MPHQQTDKTTWSARILLTLTVVVPFAVAVSSIVPDFVEYRVPRIEIGEDYVTDWWLDHESRHAVRAELNRTRVKVLGDVRGRAAVAAVADLEIGRLKVADWPEISVESP
jgi:hypothetical protein